MSKLYPLLLDSALHVKVWGGRKLGEMMGKELPTDEPYGESWEVHDTSIVANGALQGKTLGEVLAEFGADLIGEDNDPTDGLPLLVKILDAAQWLSVQVHPNDAQAAELEGEPRGKTEAWVVLGAEPGSQLVIGVEPGTDREAMAQAIHDNALEDLLVRATVQQGDVLFIPAGTVHALGPGILLYEIQQSSDTTYRLYDWGRMGLDGKPRTLHIDKGVAVSNVETLPEITHAVDGDVVALFESDFFTTTRHHLKADQAQTLDTQGQVFHALTCINGAATVNWNDHTVQFRQGQSVMIPACLGSYQLSGAGNVLISCQR